MSHANRHRGEVRAVLDGRPYTLCLTLGALAEIEEAFGGEDLLSLTKRFSQGRLRASDALSILGAALRGGGYEVDDDAVRRMTVAGGVAGLARLVAELLQAAFVGESSPGDSAPPAAGNVPALPACSPGSA